MLTKYSPQGPGRDAGADWEVAIYDGIPFPTGIPTHAEVTSAKSPQRFHISVLAPEYHTKATRIATSGEVIQLSDKDADQLIATLELAERGISNARAGRGSGTFELNAPQVILGDTNENEGRFIGQPSFGMTKYIGDQRH